VHSVLLRTDEKAYHKMVRSNEERTLHLACWRRFL